MKFQKTALGVLSLGLLLAACDNVDFKKTKGGVPYKIMEGKGGQKLKMGEVAKFQVLQKIGDSTVMNSYEGMPAYQALDSVPAGGDMYDIVPVVLEILPKLKTTDSVYIVQYADTILKHHPEAAGNPMFKKGAKITTMLKMLGSFKNTTEAQADAQKEQPAAQARMEAMAIAKFKADAKKQAQLAIDKKGIEAYLTGKGIKATQTQWGTYVQSLAPGQGPKPKAGQFMSIRYKGMNLAGEEFDSNTAPGKPVLPVQVGAGGTIKGFEDGLMQLSKGEKAVIYIPSVIGYGEQGGPPKIQPNQNLMFEIEVVDISDTPPAQPQMPMPQQPMDTTMPRR